jgi:phytol kinase
MIFNDLLLTCALIFYVFCVFYTLKFFFEFMINKGINKDSAIYYDRKMIHIFAGGITAFFITNYHSYWYPLLAGILLTIITFVSHKKGSKLYWFQTNNDFNDVNFCLMWGISITFLWIVTNNPWIAIIPAIFMSFGDGITGIIRNLIYKRRCKHPIGNVFMALICVPIGYYLGAQGSIAIIGAFAGLIASIAERFECGPFDDNVIITVSTTLFIYLAYIVLI